VADKTVIVPTVGEVREKAKAGAYDGAGEGLWWN
jgi:hypothetical protein